MSATGTVGFYGKLPCNGDFLQRRVAQEFLDLWDPWLQACIQASREELQGHWLDSYLNSPVWRFVLSEGICGSGAYAGVMIPSVDRVGRYFPLTLVVQTNAEDCALQIACSGGQQWFEAAEAVALEALEASDLELSEFDSRVASLSDLDVEQRAIEAQFLRGLMLRCEFGKRAAQWHIPLASGHSLQHAINIYASRELERTLRPMSLWWTHGSAAIAPGWLCSRGLPAPASFVAMIAAQWDRSGWISLDPDSDERGRGPQGTQPLSLDSPVIDLDRQGAPGFGLPAELAQGEPEGALGEDLQLQTWHEPVSRAAGEGASRIHFLERPEVGVWGVINGSPADADGNVAQATVDVLGTIDQMATLTTLVEAVRLELLQIQKQFDRPAQDAAEVFPAIALYIAMGRECALLSSGQVQVIRCQQTQSSWVIGSNAVERDEVAGLDERVGEQASEGASLLDLIGVPPQGQDGIQVMYEALRSQEAWILAAGPLTLEPGLMELSAKCIRERPDGDAVLQAIRSAAKGVEPAGELPVLVVTLRE